MKINKVASETNERSLNKNQDNQNKFNTEALKRISSAVQKSIEKYGMPDSSKMEKKLYFIKPKENFVK